MPPVRQSSQRHPPSSRSSRRTQPSRIEGVRTGIQSLFTGRSSMGPRNPSLESPKTPRFQLGLPNLSLTSLAIPQLTRTTTTIPRSTSNASPTASYPRFSATPSTPRGTRPITPESWRREMQQPAPLAMPSHIRHDSARRFVGVDPAEQHLAELANVGRQRRRQKRGHKERSCAPKIKNRKIRAKILSCFISGLFLTLVLTIYLALTLSNRNESQEFHVLLILVILVTTIFFCHALIRLCMMLIHPPADDDLEQGLPSMIATGGYANPSVPIRVALARDEEAAGIESDATKIPPPAYGLWRESVRVDPNRIFWQRNETAALGRQNSVGHQDGRPYTANRPPSYISEEGVDYVIEAAPRSIAPTTDVPLPPHPSERGQYWAR